MESDLDGGVGKRLERWVSVKVRKKGYGQLINGCESLERNG